MSSSSLSDSGAKRQASIMNVSSEWILVKTKQGKRLKHSQLSSSNLHFSAVVIYQTEMLVRFLIHTLHFVLFL